MDGLLEVLLVWWSAQLCIGSGGGLCIFSNAHQQIFVWSIMKMLIFGDKSSSSSILLCFVFQFCFAGIFIFYLSYGGLLLHWWWFIDVVIYRVIVGRGVAVVSAVELRWWLWIEGDVEQSDKDDRKGIGGGWWCLSRWKWW